MVTKVTASPIDWLWCFCDDVAQTQRLLREMRVRPLLLPLSIVIGLAMGPIALRAADWREYARAAMTPEFSWAKAEPVAPASRDAVAGALRDVARVEFQRALAQPTVELRFTQSRGDDLPSANLTRLSLLDEATPGLNRRSIGLQFWHELSGAGRIGAGLVVAEQQFASFGFGLHRIDDAALVPPTVGESATAAGVRLSYATALDRRWSFEAALQSKIDMQPFQSYRGVFSDPGDFDIPAEVEVTVRAAVTPTLGVSLGSRRVMYSDLKAFSSYALPERFLSLLGDGTSPVFAWRDLTIFDVALDYSIGPSSRVEIRYSTQQQPEPSSPLLLDALRSEFTDRNVAIGLTHRFDRAGEFRFAVSHAPVEYFLGPVSSLGGRDSGGDQVELEARWRIDF